MKQHPTKVDISLDVFVRANRAELNYMHNMTENQLIKRCLSKYAFRGGNV